MNTQARCGSFIQKINLHVLSWFAQGVKHMETRWYFRMFLLPPQKKKLKKKKKKKKKDALQYNKLSLN
jgi:hypothetical protein